MVSIYLFCLAVCPIVALWGIKKRTCTEALLEREDAKYLRGIASWFVVLAHYITNIKGTLIPNDAFGKFFSFAIGQLGGIGVLIFFFVSGYGIYESYAEREPEWKFLLKRIKGVYLPYLVIRVILFIPQFAVERIQGLGIKIVFAILLAEDYWFIHVIMLQYLAFFIIWKFLGASRMIFYSFLLDIVFMMVFFYEGRPEGWLNALWLFTFGMASARYQKGILAFFDKATKITIIVCIGLFGVMGFIFASNKGEWWANPFKTLGGVFLCIGICGIGRMIVPGSKIMQYFGKRSLYLYIVHMSIWPMIEIEDAVMHFWVAIGVSVLITEIMYQIVAFFINRCFKSKFV